MDPGGGGLARRGHPDTREQLTLAPIARRPPGIATPVLRRFAATGRMAFPLTHVKASARSAPRSLPQPNPAMRPEASHPTPPWRHRRDLHRFVLCAAFPSSSVPFFPGPDSHSRWLSLARSGQGGPVRLTSAATFREGSRGREAALTRSRSRTLPRAVGPAPGAGPQVADRTGPETRCPPGAFGVHSAQDESRGPPEVDDSLASAAPLPDASPPRT